MFYVLTVQDKTLPIDTRFLHVLQGSDTRREDGERQSYETNATSGTAFDGAAFWQHGGVLPHLLWNAKVALTATFTVPKSTVHTFVVAGLAANGSFKVTTQTVGAVSTVTLTPGTTGSVSDSAGLLKVSI